MNSNALLVAGSIKAGRMNSDEVTRPRVQATGATVAHILLRLGDAKARLQDAKRRVAEEENAVSAAMRGELGADAVPVSRP